MLAEQGTVLRTVKREYYLPRSDNRWLAPPNQRGKRGAPPNTPYLSNLYIYIYICVFMFLARELLFCMNVNSIPITLR